jgi:hypothetical protein
MTIDQTPPAGTTEIAADVQSAAEALLRLSSERDAVLAGQLSRLVAAVAIEAARSPRLAKTLSAALAPDRPPGKENTGTTQRPRRRAPSVLDPFAVYNEVGSEGLRNRLTGIDLERLRDILAEHRLDHDGLAMKWKDPARVIDRIIDRVAARTSKGSAFRS